MVFKGKKKNKGFTLIELLVVIAIIALLSSIVLSALSSAHVAGDDAKRISDMDQIQNALEEFYNANGYYPNPAGAFTTGSGATYQTVCDSRTWIGGSVSYVGGINGASPASTCWGNLATALSPYITLPLDTKNGLSEGIMCPNCAEYVYSVGKFNSSSNAQGYSVYAILGSYNPNRSGVLGANSSNVALGILDHTSTQASITTAIMPNLYGPIFVVSSGCTLNFNPPSGSPPYNFNGYCL